MKWSIFLAAMIALKSCGNDTPAITVKLKPEANTYLVGDTLRIQLKHNKKHSIDSTHFYLNEKRIDLPYVFSETRLGDYRLSAKHFLQGKEIESQGAIRLLHSSPPELWTYTLINAFPHDSQAYTQGLEFDGNTLYESTGLKGKSSLRKVNFKTGKPIVNNPLDASYFGEGLTILKDKIYQLTWLENTAFVYDLATLKMESSFTYNKSKEGWGLCNDGTFLYKSDGTSKIWRLDPSNGKELDYIEVTTHKTIITSINELEWVDGKIYANTYQGKKEAVLVINPQSGAIERVIDFSGLKEQVDQIPSLNVLNGIAYHPQRNTFFITGKNWSKLFEVTLKKK